MLRHACVSCCRCGLQCTLNSCIDLARRHGFHKHICFPAPACRRFAAILPSARPEAAPPASTPFTRVCAPLGPHVNTAPMFLVPTPLAFVFRTTVQTMDVGVSQESMVCTCARTHRVDTHPTNLVYTYTPLPSFAPWNQSPSYTPPSWWSLAPGDLSPSGSPAPARRPSANTHGAASATPAAAGTARSAAASSPRGPKRASRTGKVATGTSGHTTQPTAKARSAAR